MKRFMIAALALAACSTPPTAVLSDAEAANAGLLHAIETCHRNVIDGVPLDQAVSEASRGRKLERDMSWSPVVGILPPSWKLEGQVVVGLNDRGGCDVYAKSGSGPELRELALSTHFGMSSRRWVPMRIIAAPAGQVRDAVCTTDRMPAGASVGVVMTSRLDSGDAGGQRTFAATVMRAAAGDCAERGGWVIGTLAAPVTGG
jgi:hypothetical protein